ncbi:hypothetical protein FA95DRAFT_511388 [Auriscalpium vulgare]|uniref:Uncharacterized protein n=1 Tax=Auriscalpium vulgare TaxID=40419 RepID=A0ACB8RGW2_9AGAM|nr:hypothetical protein FA95DRAFT_511388 [Auriscalpium vulgare]
MHHHHHHHRPGPKQVAPEHHNPNVSKHLQAVLVLLPHTPSRSRMPRRHAGPCARRRVYAYVVRAVPARTSESESLLRMHAGQTAMMCGCAPRRCRARWTSTLIRACEAALPPGDKSTV